MRYIFILLVVLLSLGACKPFAMLSPKQDVKVYEWSLVTSWPRDLPGLGLAPELLADKVFAMSKGRLKIQVYAAGELYPALAVFDVVSQGKAEMGHSAAYYWQDQIPAAALFSSVPFGMSAQEVNAWLYRGGGLALWRELYSPYGVIPYPGGNTDAQMGGWFKKELNHVDDFKGLRVRFPGLGGEVLKRLGAIPVNVSGGKLYTALHKNEIDAAEWVGAYNDLSLGLHRTAKYYYYPGWHEPSSTLEFLINREALKALPSDLQTIVSKATRLVNSEILHEYMLNNVEALDTLANEHGVQLRQFSPEMLAEFESLTHDVLSEKSANDTQYQNILSSYQRFLFGVEKYNQLSLR